MGSKTIYHSFGKVVKGIKENEISKIIKPSFMNAKDQQQIVTIRI